MLENIDIIMNFLKEIHIPNVYKLADNDHNSRCLYVPCVNYLISPFSLLVKRIKEEI